MKTLELFHAYLDAYAQKDIDSIQAMLAEDVHLRDWNISVMGKRAAVAETVKNFNSTNSIAIQILDTYETNGSVAGELRILLDDTVELFVIDVLQFSTTGKIKAIRAYLGRSSL
jgi:steroid delta-isomerase